MFCIYTTSFFIAKMRAKTNKERHYIMEEKYIKVLLSISRINTLLKSLTSELDKVYVNLTDKEILDMFDIETAQILPMEDYE